MRLHLANLIRRSSTSALPSNFQFMRQPPHFALQGIHDQTPEPLHETVFGALQPAPLCILDGASRHMEASRDGPAGEVTDLGRRSRGFPARLKQALLVQARGRCRSPGCDAPLAWLQADHLIPWRRDGTTSLRNGQILCDPHNKAKGDRLPEDGNGGVH